MCTLAVLVRTHPRFPLVVAANRDEFLHRASTGPQVLDAARGVAGGRDLEKGGTWLGVRRDGFFCGLTNLRPETLPRPAPRSRGAVVRAVLETASVEDARRLVAALPRDEFNGFNLLFGTADELWVAYVWPSPHEAIEAVGRQAGGVPMESVAPGVHVLPTAGLDSPAYPKVRRLRERLGAPLPADWPGLRASLAEALADHTLPSWHEVPHPGPSAFLDREALRTLDAVCIHRPGYGTRSAALLALAPGRVEHYEHAEGAPCVAPFQDYTHLL